MPMYEFQCTKCDHIEEIYFSRPSGKVWIKRCEVCGQMSKKIISSGSFRVTGANAMNGYSSIPTYDEVIDANGNAKKKWGK